MIKGPEVLERTRRITTIVLDKTGTVTEGRMWLETVIPAEGVSRAELLRLAGGAEDASEHPIARAIADGARAGSVHCLPSSASPAAPDWASKRSSRDARRSSAGPSC